MKNAKTTKFLAPGLMLAVLGLAAAPAKAIDLAAKAFDMTMPNGDVVPMWGFVLDTAGCYGTTPGLARRACVDALPDPTVPGPLLVVGAASGEIVIRLTNNLPEPVSIVIPGQEMPVSNKNPAFGGTTNKGPTWDDGSDGPRPSPTARVRSFGKEAPPNGGRNVYRWRNGNGTPFKPGTYIYQSGTHPQLQVQMGLYGAIRRSVGPKEAYPGVSFDRQRDLFYSEVDPALHSPPTPANTGNYNPKHFLLHRYPTGAIGDTPVDVSIADPLDACIPTGGIGAGDDMLLRLYNAGLRELAPMMLGSHFDVVGEGGSPYQFASRQYSVILQPGSTKDLLWSPTYEGRFPIIERGLSITDPGLTGSVPGGMQTCITTAGAP